jgi:hypothetical protein
MHALVSRVHHGCPASGKSAVHGHELAVSATCTVCTLQLQDASCPNACWHQHLEQLAEAAPQRSDVTLQQCITRLLGEHVSAAILEVCNIHHWHRPACAMAAGFNSRLVVCAAWCLSEDAMPHGFVDGGVTVMSGLS